MRLLAAQACLVLVHLSGAPAWASLEGPLNAATVAYGPEELGRIAHLASGVSSQQDRTNAVAASKEAQQLGRLLFFDKRLSRDSRLSCASCHDPTKDWTDHRQVAEGLNVGTRNTPSLWNVAVNRWFGWDGAASTLWSQSLRPIENDAELGSDRVSVAKLVLIDPELRRAYEAIYGLPRQDVLVIDLTKPAKPVQGPAGDAWNAISHKAREEVNVIYSNIGKALASFIATLRTWDSSFSRFARSLLGGDPSGGGHITSAAARGLKIFVGKGNCWSCHHGPALSDGEFHNLLLPANGLRFSKDAGRYAAIPQLLDDPFNAMGHYSDDRNGSAASLLRHTRLMPSNWGQFRTPTLRNVAKTAPYMHEGQFKSLREVVSFYSTLEGSVRADHHQEHLLKPLNLTESEIDDLSTFLETLTDEQRSF